MDEKNQNNSRLQDASVSDSLTWLKSGIQLYFSNPLLLIITCAIAAVLGIFSIGILAGPLLAGVLAICLRMINKDTEVSVSDVFSKLDQFVDTMVYTLASFAIIYFGGLLLEVIPGVGGFLGFCFQIAAQTALAFGLILIVDKKIGVTQAIRESYDIFLQNPPVLICLMLATSLVVAAGALAFGVGVFLTLPVHPATIAFVYHHVIAQKEQSLDSVSVEAKIINS